MDPVDDTATGGNEGKAGQIILGLTAVVLEVWSLDQEHQDHLETCWKYGFLDPTPGLLDQKHSLAILFLYAPEAILVHQRSSLGRAEFVKV